MILDVHWKGNKCDYIVRTSYFEDRGVERHGKRSLERQPHPIPTLFMFQQSLSLTPPLFFSLSLHPSFSLSPSFFLFLSHFLE